MRKMRAPEGREENTDLIKEDEYEENGEKYAERNAR